MAGAADSNWQPPAPKIQFALLASVLKTNLLFESVAVSSSNLWLLIDLCGFDRYDFIYTARSYGGHAVTTMRALLQLTEGVGSSPTWRATATYVASKARWPRPWLSCSAKFFVCRFESKVGSMRVPMCKTEAAAG